MATTRPTAVAGSFYPDDKRALHQLVQAYLEQVPEQHYQRPKALIAPHAGYIYSGLTAAHAFRSLQAYADSYRRVLLVGPAHRLPFHGLASCSVSHFSSPLGEIKLDRERIDTLVEHYGVLELDKAHSQEHSLEVQLPFLQECLGDFLLTPIVTGSHQPQALTAIMRLFWDEADSLILVSSDLSHFHNYEQAENIDRNTTRRILQNDHHIAYEQACGADGINALLPLIADKQAHIELLDLRNSGDTAGDHARVVGYGAFYVHN